MAIGSSAALSSGAVAATTQLAAFAFQAETTTLAAAITAPTSRRKKSQDRLIRGIKTLAPGAWTKLIGLWIAAPDEASWLVNWKSPGTNNLTKAGAPTFLSDSGFTTAANTAYYDTGIGLQSLSQNDWTVGIYSKTSTASTSVDFGAQDGSGNGITLNLRNASNFFVGRLMSAVYTSAITAPWGGTGMHSVTRTGATAVRICHHGAQVDTSTIASATPSSNPTMRIGAAAGNGGFSPRNIAAAFVASPGLTQAEETAVSALVRDYLERIQYGDVDIYEAGCAPTVVNADVIVYGTTLPAIIAAYEAKRQGRSVAIVGEPYCGAEWSMGGMTSGGLGWIDVNDPTVVSGLFRQILKWCNTVYYSRADTSNQAQLSVEAKAYHMALRQMLDPNKAGATLPAMDIPVYFSTGIASVQKSGTRITSLTTNDGRIFSGRVFIGADYEGAIKPLAGIPYIIGTEAVGTQGEDHNGYSDTFTALPGASNNLSLDPYNTPATPASGLLPDMVAKPSITNGNPDPGLQSMNFRLAISKDATRQAPFDSTPPPNYNAMRYEKFGRWYAAENTIRLTNNVLLKQNALQGSLYDVNNGSGGISTDVPQSGLNYGATASNAARASIISDLRDYTRGFFYWHLYSGDSRIPANLVTDFQGIWLDPTTFLDPGTTGGAFFWPNRGYQRDPLWQLQNTGFVLNGTDTRAVDGTTPRSTNTIACASYALDKHSIRLMNNAGVMTIQGNVFISAEGGTDLRSPVPMEVVMPDAAVCTNFLTPTAPSVTKSAWSIVRMEQTLGMMGQACGMIAAIAVQEDLSVQSISYANLRNRLLTTPDSVLPILPQLN